MKLNKPISINKETAKFLKQQCENAAFHFLDPMGQRKLVYEADKTYKATCDSKYLDNANKFFEVAQRFCDLREQESAGDATASKSLSSRKILLEATISQFEKVAKTLYNQQDSDLHGKSIKNNIISDLALIRATAKIITGNVKENITTTAPLEKEKMLKHFQTQNAMARV